MDINEFIQGVGAIAEMTKAYYDHFLRVGFTAPQALDLAKSIIIAQMQVAAIMPQKEEDLD